MEESVKCPCCKHLFFEICGDGRHCCPKCKVRFVGGSRQPVLNVFNGLSPLNPFNDWRVSNHAYPGVKPLEISRKHQKGPVVSATIDCDEGTPVFVGFDPGLGDSWSNWGTYKVNSPKVTLKPLEDAPAETPSRSGWNRVLFGYRCEGRPGFVVRSSVVELGWTKGWCNHLPLEAVNSHVVAGRLMANVRR